LDKICIPHHSTKHFPYLQRGLIMQDDLITPVILAGGKGSRFWPISRRQKPAQFIPLTSSLSLFQQTLLNVSDQARYSAPIVVTNQDYDFYVIEQAKACGIELSRVIREPVQRNTAPAVTAAALVSAQRGNTILQVMQTNYHLEAGPKYYEAIDDAIRLAKVGHLVGFSQEQTLPTISPPNSGVHPYGFEEAAAMFPVSDLLGEVTTADPPDDDARQWIPGMFLFECKSYLNECRRLAPDLFHTVEKSLQTGHSDDFGITLNIQQFAKAEAISIDDAIFKTSTKRRVVERCFDCSDVNSWDRIWRRGEADIDGNVVKGPVHVQNTRNSLIITNGIHVVVDGVADLSIITTDDALYVSPLAETRSTGVIVQSLTEAPETAPLVETHKTTERPWGGFTQLLRGERFQVKRLFVDPGKRLSLQMHHHRSENWTVVCGIARVECDGEVFTMTEGQSTFIPLGAIHRIHNPGMIRLEMIEVQTGTYLGEDDIVRFEDDYGRAATAEPHFA
jgi:mannose-1-phosphate guanylyltransferase